MLAAAGFAALLRVGSALLAQVESGPGPAGPVAPPEPQGILERLFTGGMSFPIMILVMFAVLYFLMIRPESRRQKTREAMLRALRKGDTVVTASGIIGRIHRVDEKELVLHVDKDSNVKMRFLRSAISEVISEGKSTDQASAGSDSKDSK